jgi:hypothetical protein
MGITGNHSGLISIKLTNNNYDDLHGSRNNNNRGLG